jgi:hypothetical protein
MENNTKNPRRKASGFLRGRQKGVSIVEMIVYLGITSIILFALAGVSITVINWDVSNQAVSEIEQQGMEVMHVILQAIRNGDSITSPSQGVSGASLTLAMVNGAINPTLINLSSNSIYIKESTGSSIKLTNSKLIASSLSFYNLSRTTTPGVIRVQFTLGYNNPSNKPELRYSKTFYGSASLR